MDLTLTETELDLGDLSPFTSLDSSLEYLGEPTSLHVRESLCSEPPLAPEGINKLELRVLGLRLPLSCVDGQV